MSNLLLYKGKGISSAYDGEMEEKMIETL